jgi:hypothetical protein
MNKVRLSQLRNYIAMLPDDKIDMANFVRPDRPNETVREAIMPDCNTAGCIAGWETLHRLSVEDPDGRLYVSNYGGSGYTCSRIGDIDVQEYAAESLGLTPQESEHLFMGLWSTLDDTEISEDCDENNCSCEGRSRLFLKELTKAQVLAELDYCIANDHV